MFRTTRGQPWRPLGHSIAMLFLIGLMGIQGEGWAQPPLPDVIVPRKEIYGMPLDSFWIGGVKAVEPASGGFGALWEFSREFGIKIWELRNETESRTDALRDNAQRGEHIIPNLSPIDRGGNGREAIFYPFDSAQSYYWQDRFVYQAGGVSRANSTEKDVQERVFDSSNTTAGSIVAGQIAFGYDAAQHIRRYPVGENDDFVQNSNRLIENQLQYIACKTWYLVVTGHLFDELQGGGGADDDDALLEIEIWNEVPKGNSYLTAYDTVYNSVPEDTEILYKTLYITKNSLKPVGSSSSDYDIYRDTLIPINLYQDGSAMGGPLHPSNSAHRFDIRIRWTGAEKVALRSIVMRDSITQLLAGNTPADESYRQACLDTARRLLFGSLRIPNGDWRDSTVMRFYTGDEGQWFENAGYNMMDSLLYNTFGMGDSLTKGVRAYRAQARHPYASQHILTTANEITVENYHGDAIYGVEDPMGLYNLPYSQPPSIAEHNGGRYGLPVFDVTKAGVDLYTQHMQRMRIGAYITGKNNWPYAQDNWANDLGHAAWSSRRTGKRIIQWPGVHSPFNVLWDTTVRAHVPLLSHIPEAAELRLLANLGFCYGSRGVHYSWIGTTKDEFDTVSVRNHDDTVRRYKYYSDIGPIGPKTSDTNNYDTLYVVENITTNPPQRLEFPDFYTGWGVKMRELKWLGNEWLPRIGRAMAKLQWRDSYSMHFTTTQEWMSDNISGVFQSRVRPFPDTEIVASIQSFDLEGTVDPPEETYVELGLFEKVGGINPVSSAPDPLYDTNHIFVVNRRTFERSSDIADTSVLGRAMDSLTETRTIQLRFRLPHPDQTQYNFLHIREIEPDTEPLAHTPGVGRKGLDTIVYADSLVNLTLRPGGGALLRISYCPPDSNIIGGDITVNSQRKILFFNDRYHAVYWQKAASYPAKDTVYYRRSYRTSECCGPILWEPKHYAVSPDERYMSTTENDCYPSLTARAANGDTVVTVVWTNKMGIVPDPRRQVMMRNILVNEGEPVRGPIIEVGQHKGMDPREWGTPVVSSLNGGDVVAWSDSSVGIVARFRKRIFIPGAWGGGVLSPIDSVSLGDPGYGGLNQFPTMPAFAHVRSLDSNVGISWQQTFFTASPPVSGIIYARLKHTDSTGADSLVNRNYTWLSTETDRALHPSMDLGQDVWNNVYEGITWETMEPSTNGFGLWDTWLTFRSTWTPTNERPGWDSIDVTQLWGLAKLRVVEDKVWEDGFIYPNTASLNNVYDLASQFDSLFFSVAYVDPAIGMRQAMILFSSVNFKDGSPWNYVFGGTSPNSSASPDRQPDRHTVLYETPGPNPGENILRSSRQFFGAKTRPAGYIADGRKGLFILNDAARTGISIMLHDVWKADASSSQGVAMIPRTAADSVRTDDLAELSGLLRTAYFHAHDSTTIGIELAGNFFGNTSFASEAVVRAVVELVDSACGTVIQQLDSFAVSAASPFYGVRLEPTLDLLSGTYFIRLRIDTTAVTIDTVAGRSWFPVVETASAVRNDAAGKVRKLDKQSSARGRISAQPNPVVNRTEVRFSIPVRSSVSVLLYDAAGREVARPVEASIMEEGRYAVEFDASGLPAGSYILELRNGNQRVSERLLIAR